MIFFSNFYEKLTSKKISGPLSFDLNVLHCIDMCVDFDLIFLFMRNVQQWAPVNNFGYFVISSETQLNIDMCVYFDLSF